MIAFGMSLDDPATWRDMILLGTAAAMTAPRKFRGFANRTWHEGRGVDVLLGQLDELVGVIGLLFITAYFRDDVGATHVAAARHRVGVRVARPRRRDRRPDLRDDPRAGLERRVPRGRARRRSRSRRGSPAICGCRRSSICFIAGVLVTNFPNEQRDSVFRILNHLERPVHLLFLIIAGAVWDVTDWRGWALVPLFVAGRDHRQVDRRRSRRRPSSARCCRRAFADQRTLVTPMSGLSIALVISVESLYHDDGLPWIMTAVIGGSIVTELLVARTRRIR